MKAGDLSTKYLLLVPPTSQFSSVAQSCPTLCDPMDCSMPGFPVHHQLLELAQTHAHRVGDAIQPSHPPSSPSPPTFNLRSIGGFSNQSVLHTRWPEYWSFSFSISPPNEYSGLISSRMDWSDLLAVQGTLKRLLQHHSSKASILQRSAFFIDPLSHPSMTTGKPYKRDYRKPTVCVGPPPPPTALTQHSLLYDQSLQISTYSLCQRCKSIAKSENPKLPILRIHSKGSMVQKMYDNIASSYPGLQGLSDGSVGEEAAHDAGDTSLIPVSRRSPRGGNGNLL